MNPQLKGVESLPGTHLFDLALSAKALRLNPSFTASSFPTSARCSRAPLKRLSTRRCSRPKSAAWCAISTAAALIAYGASFFCLEKLGRVKGVSNPEMVAGFRGESLEAFLKTRNVPGAR